MDGFLQTQFIELRGAVFEELQIGSFGRPTIKILRGDSVKNGPWFPWGRTYGHRLQVGRDRQGYAEWRKGKRDNVSRWPWWCWNSRRWIWRGAGCRRSRSGRWFGHRCCGAGRFRDAGGGAGGSLLHG